MTDAELRAALAGTRFADVRVVPETGSTNADVLALARDGAPEGTVVVADHQTAGRGRLSRTWEAPPGSSLLLSVLTRPVTGPLELPVEAIHRVSTALGVAAAEALAAVAGVPARIKWPNDLVVDVEGDDGTGTRKLSGILAETHLEGGTVAALVVGIGINVNWPEELPEALAGTATAANLVAGRFIDRDDLLVGLLERFGHWYGRLGEPTGAAELLARYRSLSATLGRRVRVELPGEVVEGDAFDLTADGHLLVIDECPDRPREITVGDVVHLRAR
jgi:BirA family biotin operon repressor/biotin-[acetyl-CoA-carboxylase] ligase